MSQPEPLPLETYARALAHLLRRRGEPVREVLASIDLTPEAFSQAEPNMPGTRAMRISDIRSWARRSGALALAGCKAPAPPARAHGPLPPIERERCVELRSVIEARRHDLSAGRLLRALPAAGEDTAACPHESLELARIALSAAASLGDAEAVARYGRTAPPVTPPVLFEPDGPVESVPSPTETYRRAVAAYLDGTWAEAGKLGLAVGAGGGPLATEGFIVAARSAERMGDAARAARMWARAYAAGCGPSAPCKPELPREDLFGRTAYLGNFVPWYSEWFCSGFVAWGTTVVHGTWNIVAAPGEREGDVPRGGYDVREIPSRVLLEHVDPPAHVWSICWSPDGLHRVAQVQKEDGYTGVLAGTFGGPWTGLLPTGLGTGGDDRHTCVLDDGRIVFTDNVGFDVVDPGQRRFRRFRWPMTLDQLRWNMWPSKAGFFINHDLPEDSTVARYDVTTGKGTKLRPDKGRSFEVGPAIGASDVLFRESRPDMLVWLDGVTGKTRLEVPFSSGRRSNSEEGIARTSTCVWEGDSPHRGCFRALDLATGKQEVVGWLWHHPYGWTYVDDRPVYDANGEIRRELAALPAGASTWGAAPDWSVFHERGRWDWDPELEVRAPGRAPLGVVLTADRKGAMVVAEDGRFEVIGQVPAVFRASASCGQWPLEVCGAALETPGLTEAWLNNLPAAWPTRPPATP